MQWWPCHRYYHKIHKYKCKYKYRHKYKCTNKWDSGVMPKSCPVEKNWTFQIFLKYFFGGRGRIEQMGQAHIVQKIRNGKPSSPVSHHFIHLEDVFLSLVPNHWNFHSVSLSLIGDVMYSHEIVVLFSPGVNNDPDRFSKRSLTPGPWWVLIWNWLELASANVCPWQPLVESHAFQRFRNQLALETSSKVKRKPCFKFQVTP